MKRPVPMSLAALAVLGWVILLIYWVAASGNRQAMESRIAVLESDRGQLAAEFAAHEESTRTHGEILEAIDAAQAEIDELNARRDQAEDEVAARQAELEQLRDAISTGQAELAEAEAELEAATREMEGVRQEAELTADELGKASQQLVEVGARLEEARATEAQLSAAVAELSEQASVQSEHLADVEHRLQEYREAEAEIQAAAAQAREEIAQLEARREGLERSISQQEEHRAILSTDIEQSEEQRQRLQGQIAEFADALAERSQQMAELEARFASLQPEVSAMAAASASGVLPGRYVGASPAVPLLWVEAVFEADGTFEMRRGRHAASGDTETETVTGQFELANGELVLSEVEGDTGTANFPMRCAIEPRDAAFAFPQEQAMDECPLAGMTFHRVE